eukprot:g470.t1
MSQLAKVAPLEKADNISSTKTGEIEQRALPKVIPEVEVSFKIYAITSVDQSSHQWTAEFIIMLDWVGGDDDFCPKIEIENAVENAQPTHDAKPRIKNGRKTLTLKYRNCTMVTRMDMRLFPFDTQYLDIKIKSARVKVAGKNEKLELCNPKKFRKCHKIVDDADMLTEWQLIKIWGAPIAFEAPKNDNTAVHNGYCVQICVRREYLSVLLNYGFPITCIGLLSVTAFGVSPDELSDRMEINLTLTLTIVAFASILSDELPKVPYLTVLGKFNLAIFLILLVQGLAFYLVADCMTRYCTNRVESWFTGEVEGGGHVLLPDQDVNVPTESQDDACKLYTGLDKVLLIVSFLWIFGWISWMIYVARSASAKLQSVRGTGPMDPTHPSGLRIFEHQELRNDAIKCDYTNFDPSAAKAHRPSFMTIMRAKSFLN